MHRLQLLTLILLILLCPLQGKGQQEVRFGKQRVIPARNLVGKMRGQLDLGPRFEGKHYLLLQLAELPTAEARTELEKQGITLLDYVGGNAYWASVVDAQSLLRRTRGHHALSAHPILPEWKVADAILENEIPSYAFTGEGIFKAYVSWFQGIDEGTVRRELARYGVAITELSPLFLQASVLMNRDTALALAREPWVNGIAVGVAPYELYNVVGCEQARGLSLKRSGAMGGRALTGEGVRIGIFDGNVEAHDDFQDRVHRVETWSQDEQARHGTHVAGTVLGAGILDPKAQAAAHRAEAWSWNFHNERETKDVPLKMIEGYEQHGISLTNNSYGLHLKNHCHLWDQYVYTPQNFNYDLLALLIPEMTHLFAQGNDQQDCHAYLPGGYSTVTTRSKNIILVGSVDAQGNISDFSSFGPQDDGRIAPTLCTFGDAVYSTAPMGQYVTMGGTSMACPMATSHLALLTELYGQLHHGDIPRSDLLRCLAANSAEDRGNKGPDYQYGYGILNAERAAVMLEHGQYRMGKHAAGGGEQNISIEVPKGLKGLRVMLVWNDTVQRKKHGYGEKALVNDLDLLLISPDGTTFQPWVLDPQNPSQEATRGRDQLNNIEQVTLENPPEGGYTIRVKGESIASHSQEWVVSWCFEEEDFHVVAPAAGDVVSPGESFMLRLEGQQGECLVEISYDGGATFHTLGTLEGQDATVPIPADAPTTQQAQLRVSDGAGHFTLSEGYFNIAPRVKELTVKATECVGSPWALQWAKCPGVEGYSIYRINLPSGEAIKIGETTGAGSTSYTVIPEHQSISEHTPIFACARLAGGVEGPRSNTVVPISATPLVLKEDGLPYSEFFTTLPPRHFTPIQASEVMQTFFNGVTSREHPSAHVLWISAKGKIEEYNWDFNNPEQNFNGALKDSHVGGIQYCEVDFSNITGTLFLQLKGYMLSPDVRTQLVRVVVDGQSVPSVAGSSTIMTNGTFEEFFNLSEFVGRKVRLRVEYISQNADNRFNLYSLQFRKGHGTRDVQLEEVAFPSDAPRLGMERVTARVFNPSSETITELPVVLYTRGQVAAMVTLKELKPYERRAVELMADFSTENAEGEIIPCELMADTRGDANTANNSQRGEVANMGEVFALAPTDNERGRLDPGLADPWEVVEVDSPIIFTDAGGLVRNYPADQISTVRFKPKDRSKCIQLTLLDFETMGKEDLLMIYTEDIAQGIPTKGVMPTYLLWGNPRVPRVYVSEIPSGELVVSFVSMGEKQGKGWKAEVRQVTRVNSLSIEGVESAKVGSDPKSVVPITVRVKNNLPVSQYHIPVVLKLQKKRVAIEVIPEIGPGATMDYTFEKQILVTAPGRIEMEVVVNGADSEGVDNHWNGFLAYDNYCIPGTVMQPNLVQLKEMRLLDSLFGAPYSFSGISYPMDSCYTTYTGLGSTPGTLSFQGVEHDDLEARLYVDWNEDHQFTQGETLAIPLQRGVKDYPFSLPIPSDAAPGSKRMRLVVMGKDGATPCPERINIGFSIDMPLLLLEGLYPNDRDLELASLEAGESGEYLSAQQKVHFAVRNHGATPVTGFNARLLHQGVEVASEQFSSNLTPFGGSEQFTLSKEIDLSLVGTHQLELEISLPNDPTETNNRRGITLYSFKPNAGELHALSLKKGQDSKELVDFRGLKLPDDMFTATLEFWLKLDAPGICHILQTANVGLYAGHELAKYEDNALLLAFNNGTLANTQGGVIKPGQWQHIALVLTDGNDPFNPRQELTLYVNGRKEKLTFDSEEFSFTLHNLTLLRNSSACIDEMRIWSIARDAADLADGMFEHIRGANGELPPECLYEFRFDEGPGFSAVHSGKALGFINSSRIKPGADCAWITPDNLISSARFKGASTATRWVGRDEMEVIFPRETNVATVSGAISSSWPRTSLKYNGQTIDANTQFDFSNGSITISATHPGLFGKKLTQEVTIRGIVEGSRACELLALSIPKEQNAGLSNSITVTPRQSMVVKGIDANVNSAALKIEYTLSPGATLSVNGQPIQGNIINLSQPCLLTVTAENGRARKLYHIQRAESQSITWALQQNEYTYGDATVELMGESSSGLTVQYGSSASGTVAIVDNRMHFAGVGKATITALQPGGGIWDAATPLQHEVTVKRKSISVKPVDLTIAEDEQVPPIRYEFEGLAGQEEYYYLTLPSYTIMRNSSEPYDGKSPLPAGVYSIVPDATMQPYETGNYFISHFNVGRLTVVASPEHKAIFQIMDGNQPVENATVNISPWEIISNSLGEAEVKLPSGSYAYRVEKTGYEPAEGQFSMDGKARTIPVPLKPLQHRVEYQAGPNGYLVGNGSQSIATGGSTTAVTALPNARFHFVGWEDGCRDNPRIDRGVQRSANHTAHFALNEHKLRYELGLGCTLTRGETEQSIRDGEDGSEVEISIEPGYYLIGWSDGATGSKHIAKALNESTTIRPLIGRYFDLPLLQTFEASGEIPEYWQNVTPTGKYSKWRIGEGEIHMLRELKEGRYAYCAPGLEFDSNVPVEIELISPKCRVQSITTDLSISFDTQAWKFNQAEAEVYYRLDGGPWERLGEIELHEYSAPLEHCEFSVANSAITGKEHIEFKWRFATDFFFPIGIDNIKIAGEGAPSFRVAYLATEGGKIRNNTDGTTSLAAEYSISATSKGPEIEAIPDAGYSFIRWDDGVSSAIRSDAQATYAHALFTKGVPPSNEKFTLAYRAEGPGKLEGLVYQQDVPGGTAGAPVAAFPNSDGRYIFYRWSDGLTDNPRSDTPSTGNIEVTALFRRLFTVRYLAEPGGRIEGVLTQDIVEGTEGEAVTAIADEGYRFLQWDDGYPQATRKEQNVQDDLSVKAQFSRVTPDVQNSVSISERKISVLPNPFNREIEVMGDGIAWLKLYSITGSLIMSIPYSTGSVALPELPAGLYILQIGFTDGAQQQQRLVKE